MTHDATHRSSNTTALVGLFLVLGIYGLALGLGGPQGATEMIVAAQSQHVEEDSHGPEIHHEDAVHADPADSTAGHPIPAPPFWTVIPFVLLLGAIAVFPLMRLTEHWWEQNLHRFYVAAGLSLVTLLYYAVLHDTPVDGHWPAHHVVAPSDGGETMAWTVFANAIMHEYIPFIVLLFSLYTISGGIRIQGDLRAHPITNTAFIAIGGLLASFIGTTGAAMVLIRPLLETNAERKNVVPTVIFFIFVVCNCGGCLLPIGDPPLFLGYLRGVPFLWTLELFEPWLFVNLVLLAVYWTWDHFYCYPHEKEKDLVRDETQLRRLEIKGIVVNGPLLLGIVLSVALLDSSKPLPGTGGWHPWLYLREIVQLALVAVSLTAGSQTVRMANRFNYHAIVEVAALFCGIFICMQPALQILHVEGSNLGIDTPMKFFWATGALSSFLDNAPTYVVFFETAKTLPGAGPRVAGVPEDMLVAISLGAVFMGAMTYIGNGPNFMVKAIAEKSGVRMPSFFGFMMYSVVILLPILLISTLIFL